MSFCGAGNVPKGQKRATMGTCIEKGQVRYYGIAKVDPRVLKQTKIIKSLPEPLPENRTKVAVMIAEIDGLIRNAKRGIVAFKGRKDKEKELKVYMDELDGLDKKSNKLVPIFKKITIAINKEKEKETEI